MEQILKTKKKEKNPVCAVRLKPMIKDKVRSRAIESNRTMSDILREIINQEVVNF